MLQSARFSIKDCNKLNAQGPWWQPSSHLLYISHMWVWVKSSQSPTTNKSKCFAGHVNTHKRNFLCNVYKQDCFACEEALPRTGTCHSLTGPETSARVGWVVGSGWFGGENASANSSLSTWISYVKKVSKLQILEVRHLGDESSTLGVSVTWMLRDEQYAGLLSGGQRGYPVQWSGEVDRASSPGPAPGARARPARVTHRASSSRKITLLQQPANTRPTAKAGRMAGAGHRVRARRAPFQIAILGSPHWTSPQPAVRCPRAVSVHSSSAAATDATSPRAVVLSHPRLHSSEGASNGWLDYMSQHTARLYGRREKLASFPEPSRDRNAARPSGKWSSNAVCVQYQKCWNRIPRK